MAHEEARIDSYLILDARYEKVRHGGSVIDCAVLVSLGVDEKGKRNILGTSVAWSEAKVHCRSFISSLLDRGLRNVQMITSDADEGLKKALGGNVWCPLATVPVPSTA